MAVTVPNTFTDGNTIFAQEMNDNFTAITTKAADKTGAETMVGPVTLSNVAQITSAVGSIGSLAWRFLGDFATGFFQPIASALTIVCGGLEAAKFTGSGLFVGPASGGSSTDNTGLTLSTGGVLNDVAQFIQNHDDDGVLTISSTGNIVLDPGDSVGTDLVEISGDLSAGDGTFLGNVSATDVSAGGDLTVGGASTFTGLLTALGAISGATSISTGTFSGTNFTASGFMTMVEIADPANPAANSGRIYVRDNGGGKSQLCVVFGSGAPIVIATEP